MIRTVASIAFAALAITPATAQEKPAPQTVLVMLAHPDDELPMAPAIAALARQGAEVTLAYATRGDAGPGVSGMAPGEQLAKVRENEADCASDALGARSIINFFRQDGRLGIYPPQNDGKALTLVATLERFIPHYDLVLTWGPDGGYGHADHRMVSAITSQIVQALPAATRPKLLYVGIPAGTLPAIPQMAGWAETDPALLTESIAYTPADLAAATAAAQCHVTQFDEATRAGMMPLFDATSWRGKVHFRPAF
jgi:LmbE family N-acetylglucosaminyl deacetylase